MARAPRRRRETMQGMSVDARIRGDVRVRALRAASSLLQRFGADHLSMRLIASEAGIGISSIYYYFPGKEQLLVQLALGGFDALDRVLAGSTTEVASDRGAFAQAADAFLGFVSANPSLYELMCDQHLLTQHAALRSAEDTVSATFGAKVAEDARFPPQIAASIAVTFWALGRGVAATALSHPNRELDTAYLRTLGEGLGYLIDRRL
jgi:AcrR family transcriptional regulator